MWIIGFLAGAFFGVLSQQPLMIFVGGVCGLLVAGVWEAKSREREKAWQALNKRLDNLEARLMKIEVQRDHPLPAQTAQTPLVETAKAAPVAPTVNVATPSPVAPPGYSSAPPAPPIRKIPAAPPPPPLEPEPAQPPGGFWARWLQGNPLAKIGVVLLFFGIASALKVAAEHAVFPLEAKLALAVAGALVMLGLGWRQREARPMFGLAMQGGGIAILYLLVYLAYAHFGLIGARPAFFLFTLLGAACTALAVAQDGVSLAVLGMAGAFVAPTLAGTGGGQIELFGYFALLNLVVLGLVWLKDWRALSRTGFIFTFLVGLAWGLKNYQPTAFAVSEFFLVFFFLCYSLAPLLAAKFQAPGAAALGDGIPLFGVPLAALALQIGIVKYLPNGLAWSSFVAGLYYLVLAWEARRIGEEILRRAYVAIAAVLLALSIPLAFDAGLSAAFWALGGAGLIRLGLLREDENSITLGTALQFLAGSYFLVCQMTLGPFTPAPAGEMLPGMTALAVAGLVSGYWLRERGSEAPFVWWGQVWWLAAVGWAMHHYLDGITALSGWVGATALSVMLSEIVGTGLDWPALRRPAFLLGPTLLGAVLLAFPLYGHVLHGSLGAAIPLALAMFYAVLRRQEDAAVALYPQFSHHLAGWLIVALVPLELHWLAGHYWPEVPLWQALSWGAAAALCISLVQAALTRNVWPVAAHPHDYLESILFPALAIAAAWPFYANFTLSGACGLPYLPILNPLDGVLIAVFLSLARWDATHREWQGGDSGNRIKTILAAQAVVGVSALAARITHFWGGVPFRADALFRSALFQGLTSLLWTLAALSLMVFAARNGKRRLWFGGFSVLLMVGLKLMLVDLANAGTLTWSVSLIGVALLVIAAGYFAPLPPEEDEATA